MSDAAILYLTSLSLMGIVVPFSYVFVTANASGLFPVTSESYLDSPYWLSIPRRVRSYMVAFQLLAAGGYILFQGWIAVNLSSLQSFLGNRWFLFLNALALLAASSAWPVAAYYAVTRPTRILPVVCSCALLWTTAASGILYLVGCVMEEAPLYIVTGTVFFFLVTTVADGIVWAAVCIRHHRRQVRRLRRDQRLESDLGAC
jgi:hypothetical protein